MKPFVYFLLISFSLIACKENSGKKPINENKIAKQKYDSAFILLDKNQSTKAYLLLNDAKELFLKEKDSFAVAKAMVNMAIIQEAEGDYLGSIETSVSAFPFLNKKDTAHYYFIYANYNSLGINSNILKNYKDTDKFYKITLDFAKNHLDTLMVENNMANSYYTRKDYKKSLSLYNSILEKLKTKDEVYHKISINKARSLVALNPDDSSALENYWKAKHYYLKENDLWGQDGVFCYLAEFYQKKNADSSLWYAQKMMTVAKELKSTHDRLDALNLIIQNDHSKNAQKYFMTYKAISDSLEEQKNASKNQFAIVRYESEKAKIDNLKLEKSVQEKEYMLYFSLCVLFAVSIAGFNVYRRRKKRIELEAENKVRQDRLQISKKVHDVVANGLYQVMSNLEHDEDLKKDEVLNRLESMYQQSRDISYDNFSEIKRVSFHEKISELAGTFQSVDTSIFVVGNEKSFWSDIPEKIQNEIYLCVRELLVNMKKHSQANRCVLKFSKDSSTIKLNYRDNGIGFPENSQIIFKNGLKSISERVELLSGTLKIKNESGLQIEISIPLKNL